MAETKTVLASLVRPILLPSYVYSLGTGMMIAGQVLLGLKLGFGAAWLSTLIAVSGVGAMAGALVGGWIVQRFGERRGLGVTTVACSLVLGLTTVAIWADWPGIRVLFVVALLVSTLLDGVWAVARQAMVAELVPASHRGRAMNMYGACQRLGRMTGPLIAAALFTMTGPAVVCLAHAATALLAAALLITATPRGVAGGHASPPGQDVGRPMNAGAALVCVGLAMAAIEALRTNRDLLVPLWGQQGVQLADEQIALALAVGVGLELLLFLPAGWISDRHGPTIAAAGCLVLMTVGFLIMPLAGVTGFLLAAVLIGLGNGVGSGIVKLIGVTLAPASTRAIFLGRWTAVASLGGVAGPALVGAGTAIGGPQLAVLLTAALGVVSTGWLVVVCRPMINSAREAGRQQDRQVTARA